MKENSFPQKFDSFLDSIQAIFLSLLAKLGPFFVALMPALFTGYSIFYTFTDEAGEHMALFFAVVVGLAIETVGIVATHTAIDLYNAKQQDLIEPIKFRVMAWLVPVYVIGVALVVGLSGEAFTPLVKALGIASPFLTSIVYIAVALAQDMSRLESKQRLISERQSTLEDEDRQWQRVKEQREMEFKHQERLAKIRANHNKLTVNQPGQNVQETSKTHVFDQVNLSKTERKKQLLDRMIDIFTDNPNAKISTVASNLSVSRQTVYNYLDELEQDGQVSRNGNGVKVTK